MSELLHELAVGGSFGPDVQNLDKGLINLLQGLA